VLIACEGSVVVELGEEPRKRGKYGPEIEERYWCVNSLDRNFTFNNPLPGKVPIVYQHMTSFIASPLITPNLGLQEEKPIENATLPCDDLVA
jgi:hypothetical protein